MRATSSWMMTRICLWLPAEQPLSGSAAGVGKQLAYLQLCPYAAGGSGFHCCGLRDA